MRKIYFFTLSTFLFATGSFAQVNVINPTNVTPNLAGTYTSLANAITALQGITAISGPVVITLNAGNPETAPAGGYVIQFAATTTVTNRITIAGNSNIITAFTPQTSGNLNDGIFKIIGADHITIQNFAMQENAANTIAAAGVNNMTEFGVALLRASTTDGPQNNIIQNNTISLNRTYTNTFGIYSNSRASANAVTTVADITSVTGSSFGNKIYGNFISNVNYGVVFNGSGVTAQMDDGNDIGGPSLGTGNIFTNWGSAGTAASGYPNLTGSNYCIFVNHQTDDNISYNTITGAVHTTTNTCGGILKNYSVGQPAGTVNSTISYNTITVTSSNISAAMTVIQTTGLTALSTATINITNNTIQNCAITAASATGAFTGIINASEPGVLNITNNILKGNSSTATNGTCQGIMNSGAVVTTVNINNNQLGIAGSGFFTCSAINSQGFNCIVNSGAASTATVNMNYNSIAGISLVKTGSFLGIITNATGAAATNMNNNQLGTVTGSFVTYSNVQTSNLFVIGGAGGAYTSTFNLQNNDIQGITYSAAASNTTYCLFVNCVVTTFNAINNTFTNLTLNTGGTVYLIYDNVAKASGQTYTYSNNRIVTGVSKTVSGNVVFGFYCPSLSGNGASVSITGNDFSNITATGTCDVFAIYATEGTSSSDGPAKTITGNTISNITAGSGAVYGIYTDKSASDNISSNVFSNINAGGSITGIYFGPNQAQGTHNCSYNTISNISSSSGGAFGIVQGLNSIPTININNNNISGLASAGLNCVGIEVDGGANVNVYDNIISNITNSNTSAPTIYGFIAIGSTNLYVYRNKIYNLSISGVVSGTATYIYGVQVSSVVPFANINNNFISDLKAPGSSSSVDAIQGIAIVSTRTPSSFVLYYNSIYINASSTGANFSTAGIYHLANANVSTTSFTMKDNIVKNTSTASGAGHTVAYRRSDTNLGNFLSNTDFNLYYAGTPSPGNLIFYDGTNADQTLAAYQARVSPREANSISLNPNFTSITDLHLVASNNCAIDGYGTPVPGITADIDAATRDAVTPDIGADEFTSTYSTLAGIAGAATCENKTVSTLGTTYASSSCGLIAKVLPSGGAAVSGKINTCVTLDATQQYFNAEPYVQRHFDIEPATSNTTTTSATITLYFTDAEFVSFNTNTVGWPKLPTVAGGGNADPNRANLKITQYHGTATTSPSTPGNYTGNAGNGFYINPSDANIVWNGSYWAVTFDIAGFSGFYVHTNPVYPLPVSFNYLNGIKQGNDHLLSWSVTCNSTARVTLTLERSADQRNFNSVYSITADAVRCNQPFNYTDAQPLSGINYYRLKIVDVDGKITQSNTIALINGSKGFALMNVAPNPVKGNSFNLNSTSAKAGKMEIVISDMQGRVVNRQTVSLAAGFSSTTINVSTLSLGTYNIYGIMANDKSGLIRFVKQ